MLNLQTVLQTHDTCSTKGQKSHLKLSDHKDSLLKTALTAHCLTEKQLNTVKKCDRNNNELLVEKPKIRDESSVILHQDGSKRKVIKKELKLLHYCHICKKGFKDRYSVNVHVRTHTGKKLNLSLFATRIN